MSPNGSDYLLELIKPMIIKKNVVRALIPPSECNSLMMHDFHHLRDSLSTQGSQQMVKVIRH